MIRMMYIRTKDGRLFDATRSSTVTAIREENILRQAWSIEELCDYFFQFAYNVDTNKYELVYWGTLKELDEYLKDYKVALASCIRIGHDKLLLANLTDDGITFAAKMNGKGEFEVI